MDLSEKQLLLLDEFMYSDLAPQSEGMTLNQVTQAYVDPSTGKVSADLIQADIDAGNLKLSGDLPNHPEYLANVMNQIRSDSSLSSLRIDRTTPEIEGGIRAACFVDKDGDATVSFRGTGGSYQQWRENFEGYGDVSQQPERDAADFINSLPYDDITVSGHSNGGNQAMYVTVVCEDKVKRCVSYEGQGVSNEFVQEYSEQIARNQYKIKNISGEKDFVSPLLNDIAGESVYVESDSSALIFFQHGAYGILTAADDNGSFDSDGNFKSSAYVEQSLRTKIFHAFTKILADFSDVPIIGEILELTSDTLGNIVGLLISEKLNAFNIFDPAVRHKYFLIAENHIKSLFDFAKGLAGDAYEIIKGGVETLKEWGQGAIESFTSWWNSNFGGGSSSGGSGGGHRFDSGRGTGADTIKVSTDQMAEAVSHYRVQKARLTDALSKCNAAAQIITRCWAGPSALALSMRLRETYSNLSKASDRIDDAIEELSKTIEIMEQTESSAASAAASLAVGSSPFI